MTCSEGSNSCLWGLIPARPTDSLMAVTSQTKGAQQLVPWKVSKPQSVEKFHLLFVLLKSSGTGSVSGHFVTFVPSFV